ncbi:MAG TPA: hypothetical protein VLI54_03600 [Bacillota bacterium]|nr:hypothetical protein [Bacillota bacterium]
MAVGKKEDKRTGAKVFSSLSFVVAVVLVVVGVVCWNSGSQALKDVNKGLADQRIYFPPEGTPSFAPEAFPKAQKYAGKQVKDGDTAKAYADDFLAVQLALVGNGKTSFEVGAALAADPTNVALQQQQATMFQLDTSRSLMLLGGYGASVQAATLKKIGTITLAAAAVLVVVGFGEWMASKRT